MSVLVNPDKYRMRAVGAMRFVDASNLATIVSGLDARAIDQDQPLNAQTLQSRGRGYWVVSKAKGVATFLPPLALKTIGERNPVALGDIGQFPAEWAGQARDFEIRVSDTQGRYLPARFDFKMPEPSQSLWTIWGTPTPPNIDPLLLPGQTQADYIPLFNSTGRSYDAPMARIAAHIATRKADGKDHPARWALLSVKMGSTILGIGLADAAGNVEVAFPYPEVPTLAPAAAAAGRSQVSWEVTIEVHFGALATDKSSTGEDLPPKFGDILGQLSSTTKALRKLGNTTAFPATELVMGERLILRTLDASDQPQSSLFLEAS